MNHYVIRRSILRPWHMRLTPAGLSSTRLPEITCAMTGRYAGHSKGSPPKTIETTNPLYAFVLGTEWMESLNGVRWMPGHATLTIGPPSQLKR